MKYFFLTIFLGASLTAFSFAQEEISVTPESPEAIVKSIEKAVNDGDIPSVLRFLHRTKSKEGLREDIEKNLQGKNILYRVDITSVDRPEENMIRVNGRYAAYGTTFRSVGLSNFFLFEKEGGQWYLTDTDFHELWSWKFFAKLFGIVLAGVLLINALVWGVILGFRKYKKTS